MSDYLDGFVSTRAVKINICVFPQVILHRQYEPKSTLASPFYSRYRQLFLPLCTFQSLEQTRYKSFIVNMIFFRDITGRLLETSLYFGDQTVPFVNG